MRLHHLQILLIDIVLIGTDRLDAEEEGNVAAKLCEAERKNEKSSLLKYHAKGMLGKYSIIHSSVMERVHFLKDVDFDLRCLLKFQFELERHCPR